MEEASKNYSNKKLNNKKKSSILILGSSGFLGNNFLITALENGYEVVDILRYDHKKNKKILKIKKKYKNYKSFFYKEFKELKKIKNKKFDFFINFATFYSEENSDKNFIKFMNSNIIFPIIILNNLNFKIKKIINLGSMQEFFNSNSYKPKNLYAASKKAYEQFLEFYKVKHKEVQFYNIKLYETFSKSDKRKKIFPTLLNCFFKKNKFYLKNKNLELNVVHADNVSEFLLKILKNKSNTNKNIVLKNYKNTNVLKLLKNLNRKLSYKIKYEINNEIYSNQIFNKYENLKIIKVKFNIEKDILNILKSNK